MNWRILAVDDSPVARMYLRRVLEASGLPIREFLQAGDGLIAMDILREQPVDLMITDINMPRMNGEELIRWVRGHDNLSGLRIVVVSTDSSTARIDALRNSGVNGYVSKPYSPEKLRGEIERMMENTQ